MLEVKRLQKVYDTFELDCSFTVKSGRVTGLIGQNGAGKSTACLLYTSPSPRDS